MLQATANIQNTWRGRILIYDCQRQSPINAKVITSQNTNNKKTKKTSILDRCQRMTMFNSVTSLY